MTKQALADAYAAGFKDGRSSAATVHDDDAATHCVLGFDGWWQRSVDTLDRDGRLIYASPVTGLPAETEWTDWDGSGSYPPVLITDVVQVRFGSGKISQRICSAADWGWRWFEATPGYFDIVAYKVMKP